MDQIQQISQLTSHLRNTGSSSSVISQQSCKKIEDFLIHNDESKTELSLQVLEQSIQDSSVFPQAYIQMKNIISIHNTQLSEEFLAMVMKRLVRLFIESNKQQVAHLVGIISVQFYNHQMIQQMVGQLVTSGDQQIILIHQLVIELSGSTYKQESNSMGMRNKQRKNKYTFIQNHLSSLFLSTLQSAEITRIHTDILIHLILCLDDVDRITDDKEMGSKAYRIYLSNNKFQKQTLLLAVQQIFGNGKDILQFISGCAQRSSEENSKKIEVLLLVMLQLESKFFGDCDAYFQIITQNYLNIITIVSQENRIQMMKLMNTNNNIRLFSNQQYQQLAYDYMQVTINNYHNLPFNIQIYILEFYQQFNLSNFDDIHSFKQFHSSFLTGNNISIREFFLQDLPDKLTKCYSYEHYEFINYLKLLVIICHSDFQQIFTLLISPQHQNLHFQRIVITFKYLKLLFSNKKFQYLFDQTLNLQIITNLGLTFDNLHTLDQNVQYYFLKRFMKVFLYKQSIHSDKETVLQYLQQISSGENCRLQQLLTAINGIKESDKQVKLMALLSECTDQYYDKEGDCHRMSVGRQYINQSYVEGLINTHCQTAFVHIVDRDMRRTFYALLVKVFDFFYDNVMPKQQVSSIVENVMLIYVRVDSLISFQQFFSDFQFLIQKQYNDPSWYQSYMRQIFLQHINQDGFKAQLINYLGNLEDKDKFKTLNQFIKVLILCFNRLSNFDNGNRKIFEQKTYQVLEIIKICIEKLQFIDDKTNLIKVIKNIYKLFAVWFKIIDLNKFRIVQMTFGLFNILKNQWLYNLESINIEFKRMFRFIAENDYLMLNSDYETFQKISEFMLNTINEEDKEENCFKYFFGVLHGIFVEDKKSYLDIFINKQKFLMKYDEETFNNLHQEMIHKVQNIHQSVIQKLIKFCIEYILNKRVTVSSSFSKLLMVIMIYYKQNGYEQELINHMDFYGENKRSAFGNLITQFNEAVPNQINKKTIHLFHQSYQKLNQELTYQL